MKLKLDENLPERLVAVLTGLGHDVDTVRAERLIGRADSEVWNAAQAAHRFLVTQDRQATPRKQWDWSCRS